MNATRIMTSLLAVAILSVMVTDTLGQDSDQSQGDRSGRRVGRGGGFGPRGGGPGGGRHRGAGDPTMGLLRVEEVQAELQITPEQEDALRKLAEQVRQRPEGIDFSRIREMSEEERNELFANLRKDQEKNMEAAKEQLEEVLLPPQMKRLSEIALQQRGLRSLQDTAVATELELTETQKEKLIEIRDGLREKMRTRIQEMIKQRSEQGSEGFDREMFTKIREELEGEALAVLTSEQRAEFEEMKGEPFEMPEFGRDRGRPESGGRNPFERRRGRGNSDDDGGRPGGDRRRPSSEDR